MRVLELFSGTGSIGKCCDALGYECISLDIDDRADIVCDILVWDYKTYPKDHFDIVWASPPCESFSRLQKSSLGKVKKKDGKIKTMDDIEDNIKKYGDPLVLKTIEIIEYFSPELWFIENPQTGFLKEREYMKDFLFYDVDYCLFCDWGYRKRTRIWTNKKDYYNRMCGVVHGELCGNRVGQRHVVTIGKEIGDRPYLTLDEKHRIPPDLIYSLFLE